MSAAACISVPDHGGPEYGRARARADQFIITVGHELPEIEDVIMRSERDQLVVKRGAAASVAEAEDPRT